MSMTAYRWDLEESVEDALVAHLKRNIGRACMVAPAYEVAVAKFPLVLVHATNSNNENDLALFNGQRRISVTVAIVTEAVNFSEALGPAEALATSRDNHRAVKSDVIGILASAALQDELNELGLPHVLFSAAHLTAQTRDAGDGKINTEQTLDVIACPKEIA